MNAKVRKSMNNIYKYLGRSQYTTENEVECSCSLQDVLMFFSGASSIPPCGFEGIIPTMIFLHNIDAVLPTASTCDLEFRLPATYTDYQKFKDAMVLGLKGHDGFGGV